MGSRTEEQQLDAAALRALRSYLRIPSVHPTVDYEPCVDWLRDQAAAIGLPVRLEHPAHAHKPVVILTWSGSEPQLPSILLNSHMDVVPVFEENWTHPPFGAERTPDGRVFGRGAQDMKSVAVQYLHAVKRLKEQHFVPKRSVHLVFVPDEEIGSEDGWAAFVRSPAFDALHVGFALDEGMPSPLDEFFFFHGERSTWKLELVCRGTPGHGSLLMDNPAAERVRVLLNRLMEFREREKAKIAHPLAQGSVTCVNVTMIEGGKLNNVVPPEFTISVDARLATSQDHGAFEAMVRGWCADAGGDTQLRIVSRGEVEGITALDDANPWWVAFGGVFERLGCKATPLICPGGTDARFLRRLGIPALGISLMNNTPLRLHTHDECIDEQVFWRGIRIYMELLRSLTAV